MTASDVSAETPSDYRKRFAFIPVRLWRVAGIFVEPTPRWVWMRSVTELNTFAGWRAYESDNKTKRTP
jgi:hypothetical protein